MRRGAEARALVEAVEWIDAVDVLPAPFSTERVLRYLHATIGLQSFPGRFHLKVVNPTRPDADKIRPCCRNANRVHGGLVQLGRQLGFRVPRWFPINDRLELNVYVVEEIEDTAVCLDLTEGLEAVADRLVALELATIDFDVPLGTKPPWIDSCNRDGYRNRLLGSLQGVHQRDEIATGELNEVLARFDKHWAAGPLDAGRCFSQGDFSLGNVRGRELWLIDFEHSHVGGAALDMTHLCVNLMFADRTDTARQLRHHYETLRSSRGLTPLQGMSTGDRLIEPVMVSPSVSLAGLLGHLSTPLPSRRVLTCAAPSRWRVDMKLIVRCQIHDSSIFVEKVDGLLTIPRLEEVGLLLSGVIDAHHRAKSITLLHALRDETLVDDHGRACGAEVACRGEHGAGRDVGGVNEVGDLLPGGGVAARASNVGPDRPHRIAVLDTACEDRQSGRLRQPIEERRSRFGSEFVQIDGDHGAIIGHLSSNSRDRSWHLRLGLNGARAFDS
jgi:hypothetical protein